jgi:phosphatidylinositol-3-phosphatase
MIQPTKFRIAHSLVRVCVLSVVIASLSISTGGGTVPQRISAKTPCGQVKSATYRHVVWIMMENEGDAVLHSLSAPYFNRLTAQCALASNYYATSHPSLPNYIALTSGSTQGVTDDGEPSTHRLSVPSIFSELGSKWRTLAESMPRSCDRLTSGLYATRHNPAVYYTTVAATCQQNDVPLTVPLNLSAEFTLIVPNICHDMHSCPIALGDAWLKRIVPQIVKSSQYQARSLVLFITFDENNLMTSNQVPTVVIAPSVPSGERVTQRFTHFSLLRTTEALLRLKLLGGARTAASMVDPFHLGSTVQRSS